MKTNITVAFIFLFIQITQSQTFSKFIRLPSTTDVGWHIIPEEDGYIIHASVTFYTNTGFYPADWFLKTDLHGDLQWIRLVDTIPERTNIAGWESLTRLKNSAYLLTGALRDSVGDLRTGLLIKTDLNGDTIWTRTHGEYDGLYDVPFLSHELESENTLTLKWKEVEDEPTVFALLKYTAEGDFLWEKNLPVDCSLMNGYNMVPTDDGNLLFSYACYGSDFLIIPGVMKIDTLGNIIWDRLLTEYTAGYCPAVMRVETLPNGGYAFTACNPEIAFHTPDTSHLFGMNANHEKLWSVPFLNNPDPFTNRVSIVSSEKAANGDIVLCGYNDSHPDYESAGFLARVSPEGELLWQRYFVLADKPWDRPWLINFALLEEGGMIAVGGSVDSLMPPPDRDIWILKVDEDGCLIPGCTEEIIYISQSVPTEDIVTDLKEVFFKMSPNPATERVSVDFYNPVSRENVILKVYSMTGQLMYREMLEKGISQIDLAVNDYSNGLYLVVLEQEGRILQKEKLVKQ